MKAKDFIVLIVLAIAGAVAYMIFGRKPVATQPATSTTGTAGIGSLLFGQPKNGAPSTDPGAAYATAGAGFVNNIFKLFGGGGTTTMTSQTGSPAFDPTNPGADFNNQFVTYDPGVDTNLSSGFATVGSGSGNNDYSLPGNYTLALKKKKAKK